LLSQSLGSTNHSKYQQGKHPEHPGALASRPTQPAPQALPVNASFV
jgi:hypothetical protein